ncbi:hypothetical protein I3760_14G032000 [Carya illinoinensis]|nr:hypothetical protein I3760_14G032000 [Carya illinoinensis]
MRKRKGRERARDKLLAKNGYQFKVTRCPYFFRIRKKRENTLNKCLNTRLYSTEITHAILLEKTRTTFNNRVPLLHVKFKHLY